MSNSISAITPDSASTETTGHLPWRTIAQMAAAPAKGAHAKQSNLPARLRCLALSLAAVVLVAAFVLVPLAVAVHLVVSATAIVWAVAAAVLVEMFLLTASIILKTEGQEAGHAPRKNNP